MARKASVLVARVCPSCVKRAHAHVCRWVVVNVPGGTGRGPCEAWIATICCTGEVEDWSTEDIDVAARMD